MMFDHTILRFKYYIYKSYMGYRPGGVTGRVAGAKWQGQNEFHVEEPTKAII